MPKAPPPKPKAPDSSSPAMPYSQARRHPRRSPGSEPAPARLSPQRSLFQWGMNPGYMRPPLAGAFAPDGYFEAWAKCLTPEKEARPAGRTPSSVASQQPYGTRLGCGQRRNEKENLEGAGRLDSGALGFGASGVGADHAGAGLHPAG